MVASVSLGARYSVHPGVELVANAIAGLKEKTGRSLDEWLRHIDRYAPAEEKTRQQWLKEAEGLGTNYARWLSDWSLGKAGETGDPEAYLQRATGYVDAQYSGAKADLRPVFEDLLRAALRLGSDVRACPCQTMVPLYRNRVFAEIKATTRSRVDLGLALRGMKTPARLISTGGVERRDRITHRIAICSLGDIDGDVTRWLRTAYEADE